MEDLKMYTISELASLFNISGQTLRYYDKIGLIKPDVVNPKTGYRYYSERQLDDIYLVKSLKSMGMTLEEIKACLSSKDISVLEQNLKGRIREIDAKIQELQASRDYGEFILGKLKLSRRVYQDHTYELKEIEPRPVYFIPIYFKIQELARAVDVLYNSFVNSLGAKNHQDHGRIVLTIHPDQLKEKDYKIYNGIGFLLTKPAKHENCMELQGGLYATTCHIGAYNTIHNSYRRLSEYIRKNGYQIAGLSAEVSIIDSAYTDNPNEYITEVQFPVKKRVEEIVPQK